MIAAHESEMTEKASLSTKNLEHDDLNPKQPTPAKKN